MEHLKNKSEINMKSAELLDKNGLYASVIHCAYYSCFQLMKHIQLNILKISDKNVKYFNSDENLGSHETLINCIYNNFKINTNNETEIKARELKNNIGLLKKLRVKADYKNFPINNKLSNESIILSNSIQKTLNIYI